MSNESTLLGVPVKTTNEAEAKSGRPWLLAFVCFQMACQLSLLSSTLGSARVIIRTAAFAASLSLVFFLPGAGERHPASRFAGAVLAILGLELLHPTSLEAPTVAIAHTALYFSILAPLYWVPKTSVSIETLRRLLLALWAFHSTSALFGVLQVYFPGQFQPEIASSLGDDYLEGLRITLASGEHVFRPMGLTDTPGGAGVAGVYTVLLGIGFMLDRPRLPFRIALIASMFLGMIALYLCQVRSLVVMLGISMLGVLAVLGVKRRLGRVAIFAGTLGAVGVGAMAIALSVGGDSVSDRLSTLTEGDPQQIYYSNRGVFLEQTLTELLPQYPLGAGLGRWGMMGAYFGGSTGPTPIYAELNWTGWLLDGGVPMVITYLTLIIAALWFAFQVATQRAGASVEGLWLWGAILVGYDLGTLAITFNSSPFIGTFGLEFWVLNAALFAASRGLNKELPR